MIREGCGGPLEQRPLARLIGQCNFIKNADLCRRESPATTPVYTAMVVRIRLARFGRRHQPFYNIVVANARYVDQCLEAFPGHTNHPRSIHREDETNRAKDCAQF